VTLDVDILVAADPRYLPVGGLRSPLSMPRRPAHAHAPRGACGGRSASVRASRCTRAGRVAPATCPAGAASKRRPRRCSGMGEAMSVLSQVNLELVV
jgi:hypothetical protein